MCDHRRIKIQPKHLSNYRNHLINSFFFLDFADCADFYRENYRVDGIYEISPTRFKHFNVYCNMTAGGWTVLFRRDKSKDTVEFQVPMKTYAYGFGDLNNNHWLGMTFLFKNLENELKLSCFKRFG
jgi:hypothetical protein